jgi:hypothetical protein
MSQLPFIRNPIYKFLFERGLNYVLRQRPQDHSVGWVYR